jgi:hypothetical protein
MRWQEVFSGLSSALVNESDGGVRNAEAIERRFGGPTAEERRRRLMPFLWSVVAREGQMFGDPSAGSEARVTNGVAISYPGYNEMLAGFPDENITTNARTFNPNVTVLEWLNGLQPFRGRVAAFFVVGTVAVDPERAPKRYSVDRGRSAHPRRGFRCGTDGERTGREDFRNTGRSRSSTRRPRLAQSSTCAASVLVCST